MTNRELDPLRSAAVTADRQANVIFAYELLDDELDRREARKEAQENQARSIIIAAGAVMTLLLTLAKDAGVFSVDGPVAARIALVGTLAFAAGAALCAVEPSGRGSTSAWVIAP